MPGPETRFDRQSIPADPEKRRRLMWEIDREWQQGGTWPMIYHNRASENVSFRQPGQPLAP